jgi:hypothetical protein
MENIQALGPQMHSDSLGNGFQAWRTAVRDAIVRTRMWGMWGLLSELPVGVAGGRGAAGRGSDLAPDR